MMFSVSIVNLLVELINTIFFFLRCFRRFTDSPSLYTTRTTKDLIT